MGTGASRRRQGPRSRLPASRRSLPTIVRSLLTRSRREVLGGRWTSHPCLAQRAGERGAGAGPSALEVPLFVHKLS